MAFTITAPAFGFSSTSSATLTTGSFSASVGDLVIVSITADNAGTNGASSISSISDTSSNTWTQRSLLNRDPGAANAGVTQAIYSTIVTSAISSGTVTVSFSPNTRYKTCLVHRFQPSGGNTPTFRAIGVGATGSSTTPSFTSASATSGDVVFGVLSAESVDNITADSDTTNGSWSSRDWVIATVEASTHVQYKVTTGTGTQTYNPTISTTPTDYCINTLIIYEAASTPTYTLTADTASYSISELDANVYYNIIFAASTAAYTTTGTAATLTYAKGIAGDFGVYTLSGTTAALTKGGVPSGQTLTVDSGIYNYNGTDAGFKYTYVVAGTFGSYGIDGQAALVTKGRTLDATTGGTYTISGTAAGFLYGRVFTADPDTYLISGADTTNYLGKAIIATGGSYSISGTAAALTKNQVRLTADSTAYSITGTASFSYILDGTTFKLDPRISFYSNRDGLVYSYPLGVNFLKYVRNRVNTNERNNLRMTTRTTGSGLLSPEGFVRINIVAGTSYTGLYSSTGALNVILSDPDTNNSQMFHPYGPMRVTEATSSDYGMVADDGSVYAEILR